jgi:hypothetical protein
MGDDPAALLILPGYPRRARIARGDRELTTRAVARQHKRRQHQDTRPGPTTFEADLGLDRHGHEWRAIERHGKRRQCERGQRIAQRVERL